jgi:hypothetical protein
MAEQASVSGAAAKEFISDAEATAKAYEALRAKLNPRGTQYPAWSMFYEVKSPHGRHADVIAVSAWNSRGHEVWGFEVKASRNDWRNELAAPEKAHWFVERCDRWWIVAARPGIVLKDELPPGWGLMELKPNGQLWQVHPAARREALFDRHFMALMLRSAFQAAQRSASEEEKRESFGKGREQGIAEGRATCARSHDREARELVNAKGVLDAFHRHTGVHLDSWNVERVGHVVRALYNAEDRVETALHHLERVRQNALNLAKAADEEALKLRAGGRA